MLELLERDFAAALTAGMFVINRLGGTEALPGKTHPIIRSLSSNIILATGNLYAYDLRGIRDNLLPGSEAGYT